MIVTNEDEYLIEFVNYVKRLNKANDRIGHAGQALGMYGEQAIRTAMELIHTKVKWIKNE